MGLVCRSALALVFMLGSIRTAIGVADAPPVAPVLPVVEEYFGVKVTDPYRYFEDPNNPEVRAWIKGQADYASRALASIPGRDALLAPL